VKNSSSNLNQSRLLSYAGNDFVVKTRLWVVLALSAVLLQACDLEHTEPSTGEPLINRNLSAVQIDPAVYFKVDDPTDPFADVYASFRARRASDMADTTKPAPIEPYKSVHMTRNMPWSALEDILPFDWSAVRAASPQATGQLTHSIKARLALDHPDIKIVQLLLGPGALLPSHAGGSPGLYHVIGGTGEITVEGKTSTVSPGTTVKLNPYDIRRIYANSDQALKIVWIRWAPNGDQRYLAAGYYLTGANQHLQPREGVLQDEYQYWGEQFGINDVAEPTSKVALAGEKSTYASEYVALQRARKNLTDQRNPYPSVPTFLHESATPWLDAEILKKANFFWAKDVSSLGALVDRWGEVMRYKGFFQAARTDGGWDFNISQMAWGPYARYVEHSHSIPEFYYMISGPVEHWIGEQKYRAMPGDIFMTNSYETHQSRGIVDGLAFRNIGASWAPNGDRSVFKRPFYMVEPLGSQPLGAALADDVSFH
jgi:quercetin dioxygenase-like cupin family protein